MMMKYFIYLFSALSIVSWGCNDTSTENHRINAHMNKRAFKDLVADFEDSTRYKWQKPEIILNKMGNLQHKTVVDLGAGTGYFSLIMAKAGAQVDAYDIDERFLAYINTEKKHAAIQTKKIPVDDPSIDSESKDFVLVVNTYHHIEERTSYFQKVHNGLKSGGKLLIVDFKKEKTPHGPPENVRLSGLTVLKELQKAGFSKTIIDIKSLPEQYIIIAKK